MPATPAFRFSIPLSISAGASAWTTWIAAPDWQSTTGNIYVSDPVLNQIQVFSSEGRRLYTFDPGTVRGVNFNHPSAMWVQTGSCLYVVDSQSNRIALFQIRGEYAAVPMTIGELRQMTNHSDVRAKRIHVKRGIPQPARRTATPATSAWAVGA